MPVVSIPNEMLQSTDPIKKAAVAGYEKLARDLKMGSQSGVVIPSDPWKDSDGKPTGERLVDIRLLSAGGRRAVDTNITAIRYQRNIARAVLADFLMLGGDARGSFAMSKSKTGDTECRQ